MRGLFNPAFVVARSALYGYLLTFLALVIAVMLLSGLALMLSVSRLTIGLGPIPLMSFWSSNTGYGFQSEWGVGLVACGGAALGAAYAIRRLLRNVNG
jgi:hypothetical protein